ncbi:MAG: serine hydrolase domain-containing protein, partial [Acidobacteriota bacterium]
MTIQRLLLLAVFCVGVLAVVLLAARQVFATEPVSPAVVKTSPIAGVSAEVDAHLRALIDNNLHPGIAVALIDADGERFVSYGHGAEDGAAIDPDTMFEIGSITKAFNALMLAEMAERGAVALYDPVARHLPEGAQVPQRGRPIRLIDLATHTSGLPRLPSNMAPADPHNPYVDYSPEMLLDFLAEHRLRRHVGTDYEYSNLGAGLLGFALAHRADTSWEAALRASVLDPLGLKDTTVTLGDALAVRFAKGHDVLAQPVAAWDLTTLAGAGALRSSARDMAAFVAFNLGLRDSRLLAAMRSTHAQQVDSPMAGGGIGLGWHLRHTDDATIVWHNGGTAGFRSFAGFIAE